MDIYLIVFSVVCLLTFFIGIKLCIKSRDWSKESDSDIYSPPSLLETLADNEDLQRVSSPSRHHNFSRSGTSKFSEPYCNFSTLEMVKSPLRKSISEGDLLSWLDGHSINDSKESLRENETQNQVRFLKTNPPPTTNNLVTRSCEVLSNSAMYEYVEADIHPAPGPLYRSSTKRKVFSSRPLPNLPLTTDEVKERSSPRPTSISYQDFQPFVNVRREHPSNSGTVTDIHQSVPLPPFVDDTLSRSCIDLRMTIHKSRVSIHARLLPHPSLESALESPPSISTGARSSCLRDRVPYHVTSPISTAEIEDNPYEVQHTYGYGSQVEYVRSLLPYAVDPHNDYF